MAPWGILIRAFLMAEASTPSLPFPFAFPSHNLSIYRKDVDLLVSSIANQSYIYRTTSYNCYSNRRDSIVVSAASIEPSRSIDTAVTPTSRYEREKLLVRVILYRIQKMPF